MLKLIVFSIVLTTVFKAFEACDNGWTQFEQSCYYSSAIIGNVFQVRHRHKHWFGAQAECEGKGAKLAEVNTESELQFVRQLAQKRHKSVWIGGTDGDKEGQWMWASGTPVSVKDFKPVTDPRMKQFDRPEQQDCLAIVGGHWKDLNCLKTMDYICEKKNTQNKVTVSKEKKSRDIDETRRN
ncbi:C-type lectin domain family 17, member A-like [Mytilus trossulus]|uniref:C-type lectin domain family 17, member A-like n=1 Tax=Mytilus trossulus TaxID=6551 RepID=UPI003003C5CA